MGRPHDMAACRTVVGRSANPSVWSLLPSLLGPWNHDGPAKRQESVLAQPNTRLDRQNPTGCWGRRYWSASLRRPVTISARRHLAQAGVGTSRACGWQKSAAEYSREPLDPRCGDADCAAVEMASYPTQVQTAPIQGYAGRTGEVRASLAPVDAGFADFPAAQGARVKAEIIQQTDP